jgi:xanthine dehydrogenase YagS FAD-binding subunit
MKSFKIHRPRTIDDAVGLLPSGRGPAGFDEPRPLAGGQDLLTEMKEYLVQPGSVVDLSLVAGLDDFSSDGPLVLGALTTLARIAADGQVRSGWTALGEAAESVASPQIRTQATLGGNLCQRPRCWYYRHEHAPCIKKGGSECFAESGLNKYNAILGGGPSYIVHPSDCAPALVCLGASVTTSGPRGEATLPLEEFFTLPAEGSVVRENVLKANELLVRLSVPRLPAGWRSTYLKFKERGSYDFALASVALAVKYDGTKIEAARLVLGGVAPIPWRASRAEAFLAGKDDGPEVWREAAELALAGAEPLEHNGYKVPLTKGLIQKALRALGAGGTK